MYRDGRTPLADVCQWGFGKGNEILIVGERAHAVLGSILDVSARRVPLTSSGPVVYGYLVNQLAGVFDVEASEAEWYSDVERDSCRHVLRYAFHVDRLQQGIFCIPQTWRTYVLQPFVDLVVEHQLTGYRYQRVFPHTPIQPVVKIEVKKLPRSKQDRRKWPKFDTTSTKVPFDAFAAAMGTPVLSDNQKSVPLTAYRLPDVSIPSGSIVAGDLIFGGGDPFARRVTPGRYPMTLIAAKTGRADERIALAILRFSVNPIAKWEVARIHRDAKTGSQAADGYGVDSGSGGFCDANVVEALADLADPEQTLEKRIEKELAKSHRPTRDWVHLQTDVGSAAIFSSGYGDGTYQSYFGLDDAGNPVMLVTDFGVLDWPRRPD